MIQEICLAGACNRGIAYPGAIKALEDSGLLERSSLKKVVGVSIGSFIACLYISGYSVKELLNLTIETDIASFQDFSLINNKNAILNGSIFRDWVIKSISLKM
jgi:predicted acylesterase/phospholipase RssA